LNTLPRTKTPDSAGSDYFNPKILNAAAGQETIFLAFPLPTFGGGADSVSSDPRCSDVPA